MHYFNSCVTSILSEQIGEAAVSCMAKETTCSMGRARAESGCSDHIRVPTGAGGQSRSNQLQLQTSAGPTPELFSSQCHIVTARVMAVCFFGQVSDLLGVRHCLGLGLAESRKSVSHTVATKLTSRGCMLLYIAWFCKLCLAAESCRLLKEAAQAAHESRGSFFVSSAWSPCL